MSNGKISTNPYETSRIVSLLQNYGAILEDERGRIDTYSAHLGSSIKNEDGSIEDDLIKLSRDISESRELLAKNSKELVNAVDALMGVDRSLASAMGGTTNYLDNIQSILSKGLALGVTTSPIGLGYTMVLGNGNFINGLNGLETKISDIGTNISKWWDGVTNSKQFKAAVAIGSIAVSVVGIAASWAGATGATVFTFGAGAVSYGGAVAVSAYGLNNIANQATDLYRLLNDDESDDALIGTTNYLKDGAKYVGGEVGEAIGGEEGRRVGEHLATAAYYGGEWFAGSTATKALSGVHKAQQGAAVIEKVANTTSSSTKVIDTTKNATKGVSKVEKAINTTKEWAVNKAKDDVSEKVLELGGFKTDDSKHAMIREGIEVFGELSDSNAENVENWLDVGDNFLNLYDEGVSLDTCYDFGESIFNVITT